MLGRSVGLKVVIGHLLAFVEFFTVLQNKRVCVCGSTPSQNDHYLNSLHFSGMSAPHNFFLLLNVHPRILPHVTKTVVRVQEVQISQKKSCLSSKPTPIHSTSQDLSSGRSARKVSVRHPPNCLRLAPTAQRSCQSSRTKRTPRRCEAENPAGMTFSEGFLPVFIEVFTVYFG